MGKSFSYMQNPSDTSNHASPVIDDVALAEAARYALLRRLAPAIRHHLVGEFQPIGMIATMLDRRLQSDAPNLMHLRDNSAALGKLARSSADTCMNLMSWLAPKTGAVTPLSSGVADCLSLLTTEFRFRGFVIVNEMAELSLAVTTTALRSVLPAALLALSDQQPGPADVVLSAAEVPGGVALTIRRQPVERSAENSPSTEYRALTWRDVVALAQAESVGYSQSESTVQLTFLKASPAPHLAG
jgi:hypothetical protein